MRGERLVLTPSGAHAIVVHTSAHQREFMAPGQPAALGIIACPGGEKFADEMVPHLRRIYQKHYDHLADALADRYGITEAEAVRRINLASYPAPSRGDESQ